MALEHTIPSLKARDGLLLVQICRRVYQVLGSVLTRINSILEKHLVGQSI